MKKTLLSFYIVLGCILALSSCKENKKNEFVFSLENGLYDIGEYEHNKKYEQFTGEACYEFVPRDDYGTLIPFSNGVKMFTSDYMSQYTPETQYGLCTLDGRVVVEPIFSNIHTITSDDGFSGFVLVDESEVNFDENGNVVSEEMIYTVNQYLVSHDGSWCLDLENMSGFYGASEGVILIGRHNYSHNFNNGEHTFLFLDYQGNELFSTKSYEQVEPYSNGLALAKNYPINDHAGEKSTPGQCVYLDKRGNVALEGYSDGTSFTKNGVASVSDKNGKYALIDTSGKPLTDFIYDSLYIHGPNGDYFQGFTEDDKKRYIFDSKGTLIETLDAGTNYVSIQVLNDGQMVYCIHDGTGYEKWFRLSDKEPVVCKENGKMPNAYYYGGSEFIYKENQEDSYTNNEAKAIMVDVDGNTIAKFDRFSYLSWTDHDRGIITYARKNEDAKPMTEPMTDLEKMHKPYEIVLYDIRNDKEIEVFKGCSYVRQAGKNNNYLIVEQVHSNSIYYSLYDLDTNAYVQNLENLVGCEIRTVNGKDYIIASSKASTVLYDENFKVILKKYMEANV